MKKFAILFLLAAVNTLGQSRSIRTIDTVANLLARGPEREDETVLLAGFDTNRPFAELRPIKHSKTSTDTVDNGCVFPTHNGIGRWIAKDCENGIINVAWFDTDPTGVADSTAAIQAALDLVKSVEGTLIFPPGRYRLTSSLNGTTAGTGFTIVGSGRDNTEIIGNDPGYPLLDFTGANKVTLRDFTVWGNVPGTNVSLCGILWGRPASNASSGEHLMERVKVWGNFQKWGVLANSAELCVYKECEFYTGYNLAPPDNAMTAFCLSGGSGTRGLTSRYNTPGDGSGGNSCQSFYDCKFFNYTPTSVSGYATTYNLILDGVMSCVMVNPYYYSRYNSTHVRLENQSTTAWDSLDIIGARHEYLTPLSGGTEPASYSAAASEKFKSIRINGGTLTYFYGEGGSWITGLKINDVMWKTIGSIPIVDVWILIDSDLRANKGGDGSFAQTQTPTYSIRGWSDNVNLDYKRTQDYGMHSTPDLGFGRRGLVWDGATSNSAVLCNIPTNRLGTNDFTIYLRVKLPASMPGNHAGIATLTMSTNGIAQASAWTARLNVDGKIETFLFDATGAQYSSKYVPSDFWSQKKGGIADLVFVRTTNDCKVYINGFYNKGDEDQSSGSPPGWGANISASTFALGISGASSQYWRSEMYRAALFDRALTDTEILALTHSTKDLDTDALIPDLTQGFGTTIGDLGTGGYTGTIIGGVSHLLLSGTARDSDLLDGNHGTYFLNRTNHTGTQPHTTITGLGPLATADAPTNGLMHGRLDGAWTAIASNHVAGLSNWMSLKSDVGHTQSYTTIAGLGDLAVLDDAASDGGYWGRRNGAWDEVASAEHVHDQYFPSAATTNSPMTGDLLLKKTLPSLFFSDDSSSLGGGVAFGVGGFVIGPVAYGNPDYIGTPWVGISTNGALTVLDDVLSSGDGSFSGTVSGTMLAGERLELDTASNTNAPAAGMVAIFLRQVGGDGQLVARFPTGADHVLAPAPAAGGGATNVFAEMTNILVAGANVALAIDTTNQTITISATTGGGATNGTTLSVNGGAALTLANINSTTGIAAAITSTNITFSIVDRDFGDVTVSSSGTVFTIDADAVALGTDTTGNYVASVAGTANEVTVTGSGEGASVTISLPTTIDLGGKTSFELPNAAAPTVDAFGEIAGDNDAWGAGRGALVTYDGTASTRLVGVLSSDTPTAGQVPKYQTGGTVTWEDDDSGAGGVADGDKGDVTVASSGSVWTIDANSVALGTDTTGDYVATVSGTANEVSASGSGEGAAVTVSLPATVDLGGKTSFELPNGAAPTVDAFGEIAGDNDAWAAGRGAPVFYDGTASVRLVGTLSSDTPTAGQVPKWQTGGTITWEDDTGSASGYLPLTAGLSYPLSGDLHFDQASDARIVMLETGKIEQEWYRAWGIRAYNGLFYIGTSATNDFTWNENWITFDPSQDSGGTNIITFGNEGYNNKVLFEADVEFRGTVSGPLRVPGGRINGWTAPQMTPGTNAATQAQYKVLGDGIPTVEFDGATSEEISMVGLLSQDPDRGSFVTITFASDDTANTVCWQAQWQLLTLRGIDTNLLSTAATWTSNIPGTARVPTNITFSLNAPTGIFGSTNDFSKPYMLRITRLPGSDSSLSNAYLIGVDHRYGL